MHFLEAAEWFVKGLVLALVLTLLIQFFELCSETPNLSPQGHSHD